MKTGRQARAGKRRRLMREIGRDTARFQELSYAFDDVAAEVLALRRSDLPCLAALLFNGPASAEDLARELNAGRAAVADTLDRLQLAGYARMQPGSSRVELTEHARQWVERIWAPMRQEGIQLLDRFATRDLAAIGAFVQQACAVSETRGRRLRTWLALPSSPARRPHLRGGLSPAALRRVQLFVDANLGTPIYLQDLAARAALSPYHFARAFKVTAGLTPRAYIEHRRVERARQLLTETDRAVADIAVETGLGTQSRLTTIFRRRTGFTPAAYRRGRK